MDEKLQIVEHLYGEAADRAAYHRLLDNEALREEYQAMSAVKFALDHRPRQRPDAAVVDRILAAAAGEALRPAPRADRPARRRVTRRALLWVGMAAAAVLVAGLGLRALRTDRPAPAVALEADAPPPESLPAASPVEAALAWDQADEVRRLHRQIERLRQHNVGLRWGEPVVPLELLGDAASGSARVRTAGARPGNQ